MKKKIIVSFFVFALFFGHAPGTKAQSCLDSNGNSECGAGEVCCPLPPTGSVSECRTRASCASVSPVQNNDGQVAKKGLFDNPLESDSLLELFGKIVQTVVRIAAVLLIFAFVWVGFQFAAAQGNTEKLSKARMALLWTVVGAAIILGAEGIAMVIGATAATLAP